MSEDRWERVGAASGLAMVLVGATATVFERSPVAAADFAEHRGPLLAQSMLFTAGAALALWFFGTLRGYLARYEGGTGRLSGIALAGGIGWVSVNLMAQAFQVGLADDATASASPALLRIALATFTIANLPLAVTLLAVTLVSLRYKAFPTWLAAVSLVAAGAQVLLWASTAISSGPLAPVGWLSFALYPVFLVWVVSASVIMMRRRPLAEPTTRH